MPQIQQPQQRLQLRAARFPKSAEILVADDPKAEFFYIIQSGFVLVSMNTDTANGSGAKKGPGDFIGVISCMSHRSQVEKAIALTDVIAIAVHRTQYMDLIKLSTPTALKIIRTFSKTTKAMNELLMLQTTNKKVNENQALIYQVAKYYDDDGQEYISAFAFDKFIKLNIQSPALEYAKRRLLELKQKLKVYPNPEESLRHYPRGTMIFSEFQTGAEMYVIQSGSVKISKVLNGTEVTLAVLKPGQMFGEMALLNNDLRSASAITVEDSDIRAINMANFQKITESSPDMITNLTKTFAERLWIMQRQLINSRLRDDPVAKMIDILALQLEKMNYTENTSVEYQTEFSPNDIATMCGLTKSEQSRCMFNFMNFRFIETKKNKIFVSDCSEVIKQAAFYRKKLLRNQ